MPEDEGKQHREYDRLWRRLWRKVHGDEENEGRRKAAKADRRVEEEEEEAAEARMRRWKHLGDQAHELLRLLDNVGGFMQATVDDLEVLYATPPNPFPTSDTYREWLIGQFELDMEGAQGRAGRRMARFSELQTELLALERQDDRFELEPLFRQGPWWWSKLADLRDWTPPPQEEWAIGA